jgi:hypothetical protein
LHCACNKYTHPRPPNPSPPSGEGRKTDSRNRIVYEVRAAFTGRPMKEGKAARNGDCLIHRPVDAVGWGRSGGQARAGGARIGFLVALHAR